MKTVIITGGSGNLGKASIEKFLAEGYQVIATTAPGKSLGFDAKGIDTYEADLTDESSASQVIEKIISKYPRIDAALLLVGGYTGGGLKDANGGALKKMFSMNFETAYYIARPLFEHMLTQQNGGKLVFIGARPALSAKHANSALAYALSKSLLFKLADSLNEMGSSKNVTTTVIVPSTIDTPINRQYMPNADFSSWVRPEEIAEAMAHVCADVSRSWRDTVLKIYGRA